MERYSVKLPSDDIIVRRDTFIVDEIMPLSIRYAGTNNWVIMFVANQTSTEESILIQIMLSVTKEDDIEFLKAHPLNLDNIKNDKERLKFYIAMTQDADNSILYSCDFNMKDAKTKPYYLATCANMIPKLGGATVKDLMITRDNFIKLSLFFIKLSCHDTNAEEVFVNHKLKNIVFSTINHIKLDGSSTDMTSRIVCSHYTCGNGPETYRFNYISPKINGSTLRAPMMPQVYSQFYADHFTVSDFIYDENDDCLYVIYEQRSDITDKYKCTFALRFDKEFYERTGILDYSKIYNPKENK